MDEESTDVPEREPADPEEVAEWTDRVLDHWDEVVADMEATAEQYRDDGYDVVAVHPGDVTPVTESERLDRWGLDVLVPDNEHSEVERRVVEEDGQFDACEVFRATADGIVYVVVVMLDEHEREAVAFPLYYDPDDAVDVLRRARAEGRMHTHLRNLQEDPVITFTQDDPSLFIPE